MKKRQQQGPIPGWKLWIVDQLGLTRHLYLGPEGIEAALRNRSFQARQNGWKEGLENNPDCYRCPLWQEKHTDPLMSTPQDKALQKLIGTKTLPTFIGEMARKYTKLHQEGV